MTVARNYMHHVADDKVLVWHDPMQYVPRNYSSTQNRPKNQSVASATLDVDPRSEQLEPESQTVDAPPVPGGTWDLCMQCGRQFHLNTYVDVPQMIV